MTFTVADLLDQLSSDTFMPLAGLETALGLASAEDRSLLALSLDPLARLGLLDRREEGLRRLDNPELIPARLRCSSKGFCFALREDGGEDIYIRDHQLNHAWNGDRVLVKVTREGGRRRSPEGAVQCILARETTSLLAQVERREEGELQAVPLDERLLTSITLPPEDETHADRAEEAVVEVAIDRFPVAQFGALGHVARSLPVRGGEAADLDLLLTKHHLHARPAAPQDSLRSPEEKNRTDLSALPVLLPVAWQSSEAPALPGLSLETREEGGWRLWLHAPSLGERVAAGSALDSWLAQQGEAICAGRSWLPLLPPELAGAAAFNPGERREAISVALELSAEGRLEHFRFCLSTILPTAHLDPAALTALAERKPRARTVPAALRPLKEHLPLIEQLQTVTALLESRRLEAGSLDLDLALPELQSLADLRLPTPDAPRAGWLVRLDPAQPLRLLREAVLVAERALGRHLAALQLPGLFAGQAGPDPEALNDVAKAALSLEIPLELSPEGNADAAELAVAFAATDRCRPLQQQLSGCLRPVELSDEPQPHALAGEEQACAPWCCPTLHYADLWNQRLLVLLLSEGRDRPSVRHKSGVDLASDACHGSTDWPLLSDDQLEPFRHDLGHGLAKRLNGRRRFLGDFQSDVLAMAQARYAEPLVGQVLPGVISGVQSYGFFVEVPPSQVEGLVHVSSLKDDWYEYRSRQNRLVGRKNRRTYMVGDTVAVEIQKVDALRHQIDLAVIQPEGEEPGGTLATEAGSSPADAVAEGAELALADL
ncbi:MAG: RNB domain-containing ribonuclease [Cyanobacteriota bacterium]|nr:RNB domain-containing ribonuclease [Cyanobacteriota bacterium]